jgi:hypothetical protein
MKGRQDRAHYSEERACFYRYAEKIIICFLEVFMVYGYIRVSTDKQTVENQRFEIQRFCTKNGLAVGQWIEVTVKIYYSFLMILYHFRFL